MTITHPSRNKNTTLGCHLILFQTENAHSHSPILFSFRTNSCFLTVRNSIQRDILKHPGDEKSSGETSVYLNLYLHIID